MLDHTPGLRARAERGEVLFGTMESWLIWNFTGGANGGLHATDVTNASRTMLMNIDTLEWDDELLAAFDVPRAVLPEIRPSSGVFATATEVLPGVRIGAALGDQQAALFGQTCFSAGRGEVHLRHRLVPAAAHRPGDRPVHARHAHHGRLPDRRRARGVRARRLDGGHRLARPVVPRRARPDPHRGRDRDAGPDRRRQRRRLHRAGVLRVCSRRTGAARLAA